MTYLARSSIISFSSDHVIKVSKLQEEILEEDFAVSTGSRCYSGLANH